MGLSLCLPVPRQGIVKDIQHQGHTSYSGKLESVSVGYRQATLGEDLLHPA